MSNIHLKDRKDYKKVDEIIGIAAGHIENSAEFNEFVKEKQIPKELVTIIVDPVKCNGCTRCTSCCNGAITMEEGLAIIDLECCERCGICETICPVQAIAIQRIGQKETALTGESFPHT